MKIPGNEITEVYVFLKQTYTELAKLGYQLHEDLPLTIIGNQFPNFEWLKYHPRLSIGGSPKYFDHVGDHGVVIFDPVLNQLVWYNPDLENGEITTAWHPITKERDEQVTQVSRWINFLEDWWKW